MGAGKTTFTRALAEGLGVDRPQRVCSPTFNICLVHPGPVPLWHVDLFRVGQAQAEDAAAALPAFEALGLEALLDEIQDEAFEVSAGVLVIEWADLWIRGGAIEGLRVELQRPRGRPQYRDLKATAVGSRHETLLRSWADR